MKALYILLVVFFLISCSNDEAMDDFTEKEVIEEIEDSTSVDPENVFAGEVTYYDAVKSEDGLVLVNDAASNRIYLMEKEESIILKEWNLPSGIGNDGELLANGNLLVALTDPDPVYSFGGFGGRVAIITPEEEIIWDYKYSDSINLAHHDIEMLPNGNILILAWEKKTGSELVTKGYEGPYESVYSEKLVEINPSDNQIVWEWHAWDHLVQNSSSEAEDFGEISEHPERINLNYIDPLKDGSYNGDIFHANGLEYDESRDLIYLSVNYYSEIWVIDHSTTAEEAKTTKGGFRDRGGDLVYRFGNPSTYNNLNGKRTFFHNHHPNLVPNSNTILVYSNGILSEDPHSVVFELEIPEIFELNAQRDNELNVLWSFSHPDLYSPKVSGAQRLANGNTLITEGTSGYWEVTDSGEIVWRFESEGFFWRGYHYNRISPEILNLNL
ncbi:aryl-sulfate sulfotransferase [Christiangramia sp.]|uniref:aryl-sulfate sulfotransferase n=1 Tax=Christiangramia sp. TaxID=1931228 RepID=UPI0026125F86|nr:aryl-sulfate sulfotransferase [Christiangramia sp.]